ncbi:hypothetical protein F4813DRAFT_397165 [Daldinia decipiens]|uniref:uncharacterized protein n=1 Tax=Daldinia decipiens TaxID=326647 RepID=UPI0020C2D784|nr:uncharacterized protein F4813DRAFT_397165 [Daldinia decipiens]KAI1656916.1 hypothetical protein F4813DRAFT_397165 [Daldinia decipiens]
MLLIRSTLLFLLESYLVLQVLAVTCYHLDGTNAGPSNEVCNPNATGVEGSHSACCSAENGDACLSTGLCLNTIARQQSHLLWSTACTDPTFKDPSCPQYCLGLKLDNAHLKTCNDTFWCCASDANVLTTQLCCDNAFKLTQPIGTVVAQLQSGKGAIPLATASSTISGSSNTNSSTENPSSISSGAVAGLAIEGVIIASALAGLGFMIWRNRLLSRKVKEAEAAAAAATSAQQQQYQWQHPPSSYANTVPHMAMYNYGGPGETEPPKRSELHSSTYTELPGTDIVGTELSSETRSPRSPGIPLQR